MFTNISWGNYIIAVSVLLLIWYLILGLKFYYQDLKKIISGEQKIQFPSSKRKSIKDEVVEESLSSKFSETFDTLEDAEELSNRLVQAIEESAQRNLSIQELQNYIQMILSEYQYVKISSLRENINNLIVTECEKHLQLVLTYREVDNLWNEIL